MTTASYPVTGQNITHAMWSDLGRRHHQGIDTGMTMTLSSTTDIATIAVGRASFMGFELEVTDPHALTLPAVATTKTYVVGVLYDPADEAATEGPLSLVVGVKGLITVPTGGALWPLYEVTRQPSQTLNLAAVVSYRALRMTTLYEPSAGVELPDKAFVQGPQMIVRPNGVWVNAGGNTAWASVGGDTGFVTSGFASSAGWSNAGSVYRILNGAVHLHLIATRTGGTLTATSAGDYSDTAIQTIPAAVRSDYLIVGRGNLTQSGSATIGFDWRITGAGAWTLTAANPGLVIATGSVLYATATYAI